jgi:GNAT superfamily N-acetyltransferase
VQGARAGSARTKKRAQSETRRTQGRGSTCERAEQWLHGPCEGQVGEKETNDKEKKRGTLRAHREESLYKSRERRRTDKHLRKKKTDFQPNKIKIAACEGPFVAKKPLAEGAMETSEPSPGWIARHLDGDRDSSRVLDICKTVFQGRDYMPALLPKLLVDSHVRCYALEDTDTKTLVAVSITGLIDGGRTAYLFGMRVAEECRGRGVAKALLSHQLREAATLGCERARFTRDCKIEATRRLAQSLGFVQTALFPLVRWEGVAEVAEMTAKLQREARGEQNKKKEESAQLRRIDDSSEFATLAHSHLFVTDTWKPLELFKEVRESGRVLSMWCGEEKKEENRNRSTSVALHGPGSVCVGGMYFVSVSHCDAQSSLAHLLMHLQLARESNYEDFCAVFGNEQLEEERPSWFARNCRGLEGVKVSMVELKLSNQVAAIANS